MAWSWSHAPEAYSNAFENLHDLPADTLYIIWAEWYATKKGTADFNPQFKANRYEKCLDFARKLPTDTLANDIWERMERLATCDNGGFNAYACPYGCHKVSFGRDPE